MVFVFKPICLIEQSLFYISVFYKFTRVVIVSNKFPGRYRLYIKYIELSLGTAFLVSV